MKDYFIRWKGHLYTSPYKGNKNNILVIGDLHAPFTDREYLQFCRHQQEKYDCGTIIFIGDIVDLHYSSFHDSDPDGLSAGDEADSAQKQLKEWYRMFPRAIVTIGNHDLIIYRKMFASGLSRKYAKTWNDLFDAPKGWQFVDKIVINDVMYTHGVSNALKRMQDARISVVQGHLHSLGYVQHSVSERNTLFAMQVGCGIDDTSFAFVYNKGFNKKSVISCGAVLDRGTLPIIILK